MILIFLLFVLFYVSTMWKLASFSTGEAHLAPFQVMKYFLEFLDCYNTICQACFQGSCLKSYWGLLSTHSSVTFSSNFSTAMFFFSPDIFILEFSFSCCFPFYHLRWEEQEKFKAVLVFLSLLRQKSWLLDWRVPGELYIRNYTSSSDIPSGVHPSCGFCPSGAEVIWVNGWLQKQASKCKTICLTASFFF